MEENGVEVVVVVVLAELGVELVATVGGKGTKFTSGLIAELEVGRIMEDGKELTLSDTKIGGLQ